MLHFIVAGRSGNGDYLVYVLLEFLKIQRSVIVCRRQTKAVVYKIFLSRPISAVHAPDLWQGNVALVHEHKIVLRKIVKQGIGS